MTQAAGRALSELALDLAGSLPDADSDSLSVICSVSYAACWPRREVMLCFPWRGMTSCNG